MFELMTIHENNFLVEGLKLLFFLLIYMYYNAKMYIKRKIKNEQKISKLQILLLGWR